MYKGKKLLTCILSFLVISAFNLASFPSLTKAQTTTTVYINPELTLTQLNTTFSVNISVSDVTDLCSWQAYIYYKNEILNAIGYSEGPFLKSYGPTLFDGGYNNNYNATHGEIWMYCLRTWSGKGVNGSGTLATVTFKAIIGGTTPLSLANTILGNSTAQRISHTTKDGLVEVAGKNIAVTSIIPGQTIVGQGYTMNINVTVANQGGQTETFNITIYANTTTIQTRQVTLTNKTSTTITFTWNTTGFAYGNYTIWAYACPLPGETDIGDNNMTSIIQVHVGVPGNVWGNPNPPPVYDNVCNMRDVTYLILHFNTKPGSPNWDPNSDVNNDGVCNMRDVTIAILNFNQREV
jgi:hypothetical protein